MSIKDEMIDALEAEARGTERQISDMIARLAAVEAERGRLSAVIRDSSHTRDCGIYAPDPRLSKRCDCPKWVLAEITKEPT